MADPTPEPTPAPAPLVPSNPQYLGAQDRQAAAMAASAEQMQRMADSAALVLQPQLLSEASLRFGLITTLLQAYGSGLPATKADGTPAPDPVRLAYDRSGDLLRWLKMDHGAGIAPPAA